ncbi:MAG: diacylglycerol kinase family protein, partial [Planctomycetaceae bacterium]
LRTQRNMRIHLAATGLTVLLATALRCGAVEWGVLLLTIGLVWATELINTAIEAVVDLVSPQEHELARIAKDTASGAVLAAAVTSVFVGAILFGPRLWKLWE